LTSALAGGKWSASRLGRFTPAERAPGTHWIGGWVGPRAGLDNVVKRKFVQPEASRYTDYATPAHDERVVTVFNTIYLLATIKAKNETVIITVVIKTEILQNNLVSDFFHIHTHNFIISKLFTYEIPKVNSPF
jgi:hypothetical protein